MSVDASYTTTRFPRWSSTGNAAARPDAWPALHLSSSGAPKSSLSTAHSNLPITWLSPVRPAIERRVRLLQTVHRNVAGHSSSH